MKFFSYQGTKKPTLLRIIAYLEISTFLIPIYTLIRIDYYPVFMIFPPFLVVPIGIFTMKLKPLARRINLLLSPIIVFTYAFGLMMIFEIVATVVKLKLEPVRWHFNILCLLLFIAHIFYFTRAKTKDLFS